MFMKTTKLIIAFICAVMMFTVAGHVFAAEKSIEGQAVEQAAVEEAAGKIDLNSADSQMLAQLPGIGLKKAEMITAYREANGPFKSVDELLEVKGIGPKVLEKLKPLITLS